MNIMSEKGNYKTALNTGYISGELSLAPSNFSGYEVCNKKSKGCAESCLGYFSGQNVMKPAREAKIRKTKLFFENRTEFMYLLKEDLAFLERKGKRKNLPVCVRLNCYSDLPWENIKIDGKNIMELFPSIQFYDYTANPFRMGKVPKNYHLTFSRKEDNQASVKKVLKGGHNVAVVFKHLPKTYLGKKVIDGDKTDLRFLDEKGVVVGLTPKGAGKKDTSGFVI